MSTITLAGNYINANDPFDGNPFNDVGYGHLQLVMDGLEIEVQLPTTWEQINLPTEIIIFQS